VLPLAALALAACGGAQNGRTDAAPPPPPPATAPPPAAAAPELEALLPDEAGGVALVKASATGARVFGGDAFSRSLTAFLQSVGKRPAELRFANARAPSGDAGLETGVFHVAGTEADRLLQAIVEASLPAAPGSAVREATVGGKPVTALAYANGSTLYLYAHSDTVFYVGSRAEEPAAEILRGYP
jgi:hypothetical protein